jgi:hypothetical protein
MFSNRPDVTRSEFAAEAQFRRKREDLDDMTAGPIGAYGAALEMDAYDFTSQVLCMTANLPSNYDLGEAIRRIVKRDLDALAASASTRTAPAEVDYETGRLLAVA